MFILLFLVITFCVAILLNEVGVRGLWATLIGMLIAGAVSLYTWHLLTGLPLTKVL